MLRGAGGDLLAGHGREVVGHLERPEALRTGVRTGRARPRARTRGRPGRGRCRRHPRAGPSTGCRGVLVQQGAHEVLLLICPRDSRVGRIWHLLPRLPAVRPDRRLTGGCRDFVGPFPQSLVMSTLSLGRPSHDVHIESTMWIGRRPRRGQRRVEQSGRGAPRRPAGPSTTTSASSTRSGCSVRGRAHHQAGQALGAQRADRLEGLDVAEVVAAEDHAGGLLLGDEGAQGVTLVHVTRADLDDVATGLDGEVVALGEGGDRGFTSRSKAPVGSSMRRVCTATARPFSST